MQETENKYKKSGFGAGTTNAMIGLVVGVGVATLVLVFVGALSGQVYNEVESDIDEISNTTIRDLIKSASVEGFSALEQTGSYIPIVVLALIITLVLALVLSMTSFTQGGGMRGSAL